jgi:rubrerythrin
MAGEGAAEVRCQGSEGAKEMSVKVARLVRDLLNHSSLTQVFSDALEKVDSSSATSSFSLRVPLAQLVVLDPCLLQRNFYRHAAAEMATSETLKGVAHGLKQTSLRRELVDHAADEQRHSRMFAALADGLSGWTATAERDRFGWIVEDDRKFVDSYTGDVVEFICNLFAGESRTYAFLSAYLTALNESRPVYGDKIQRVLEQILADERRHIDYTARYLNRWMEEGADLMTSIQTSFKGFDRNSWVDVITTAEYFAGRA